MTDNPIHNPEKKPVPPMTLRQAFTNMQLAYQVGWRDFHTMLALDFIETLMTLKSLSDEDLNTVCKDSHRDVIINPNREGFDPKCWMGEERDDD